MSHAIECPSDCSFVLPAVKFSECAPTTKEGQVTDMFLANVGNEFSNWESLAEWAGRVDNDDVSDPSKVRHLTVIGDVPKPEITTQVISHKRKIVSSKKRTVNFRIDDNTDENYDFMRTLECGGSFLMWYLTNAGDLYGGNEGIQCTVDLSEVVPESTDEFTTLQGSAEWDERISPPRIPSPFTIAEVDPDTV